MSGVNRWARAIKQFWKQQSLIGKETVKLVGKDHLGNKYYEANRPNHIRPVQRYFDRPEVKSFTDVVDAAHVPPPWDAWLRFRRQEPPTEEEVKDSEEYYRMQQDMAAKRKEKEPSEKKDEDATEMLKTKKSRLSKIYTDQGPHG